MSRDAPSMRFHYWDFVVITAYYTKTCTLYFSFSDNQAAAQIAFKQVLGE